MHARTRTNMKNLSLHSLPDLKLHPHSHLPGPRARAHAHTRTHTHTQVIAPQYSELTPAELKQRLEGEAQQESFDDEEDISDETMAARHQVVLRQMKIRIDEIKQEFEKSDHPRTQKRRNR